jgi:Na+/H+ antiporter NhaC
MGDIMSEKKGNALALLPIGVFLSVFLGIGIAVGDFYAIDAIVAFLVALLVAFVQNRKLPFAQKLKIAGAGVGDDNIFTMCLIFLLAGAFSGCVTAAGGVSSTVNFCLSILPLQFAVPGLFLIGCLISVSMGTSMGTIAALAPIAAGISEKTEFSMAICIGAVACGAMFGDNLSMISDTTIAAVKTQGCEMKDKFKENFLIVLPAAIVTVAVFIFLSKDATGVELGELKYNIWQVIPYILVLVGALIGLNVFLVLISGTVVSAVVGVLTDSINLSEVFKPIGSGVQSMYDITVISIVVAAIVALVKENGGIDYILTLIRRFIKGRRGAEAGIAALSVLTDACTANNTVAIVIAGPVAKEISTEYGVSNKRTASLLDIFSSVGQGLIPYGAQLLSAATLTALTPFDIIPYMIYPMLMAVSATGFIIFGKTKLK